MRSLDESNGQLPAPGLGAILFAWQELIVLRHQEALGFGQQCHAVAP
jgi:hypothetical protein